MARTGAAREQIGARLRFEILRRCNFACYYCGVPASLGLKVLHIDHVIPVDLGGTNDPWNLVSACWDCNAGKTNGVPDDALIQRVRGDYCAYLDSTEGRVIACRYCSVPVQIDPEDEELADHCLRCDSILFYGYDNGAGIERAWVAP
jgi:hypothetical protein